MRWCLFSYLFCQCFRPPSGERGPSEAPCWYFPWWPGSSCVWGISARPRISASWRVWCLCSGPMPGSRKHKTGQPVERASPDQVLATSDRGRGALSHEQTSCWNQLCNVARSHFVDIKPPSSTHLWGWTWHDGHLQRSPVKWSSQYVKANTICESYTGKAQKRCTIRVDSLDLLQNLMSCRLMQHF